VEEAVFDHLIFWLLFVFCSDPTPVCGNEVEPLSLSEEPWIFEPQETRVCRANFLIFRAELNKLAKEIRIIDPGTNLLNVATRCNLQYWDCCPALNDLDG